MNFKTLLTIGVAAMACMGPMTASATPLLFDFSGPSGTAVFQLDSNPTPDFSSTFIGSDQFGFNNVAGTYDGSPDVASTISFGNGIFSSLSITAPGLGFTQFSSPNLFTGTFDAPKFSTGSFTLINPFFGNGSLTISQIATAAPEPTTWAMTIIGFGAIGLTMRRRQAKIGNRNQLA